MDCVSMIEGKIALKEKLQNLHDLWGIGFPLSYRFES